MKKFILPRCGKQPVKCQLTVSDDVEMYAKCIKTEDTAERNRIITEIFARHGVQLEEKHGVKQLGGMYKRIVGYLNDPSLATELKALFDEHGLPFPEAVEETEEGAINE